MRKALLVAGAAFAAAAITPALAQEDTTVAGPADEVEDSPSVYEGDWVSLGAGVGYGPSYDGSDDYVLFPAPLIQGQIGPIGINPRPAGIALDFVKDPEDGVGFDFGVAARLRSNRADQIEDPVVEAAGELDRAFEIGPAAGVSIPGLLNPYDSLSFTVDARWDVAGAHEGMVVDPSVSYFTPLSRGMATALTLSAEHADGDYADYYYSVSPAQSLASGLPLYQAEGGFTKAGATVLLALDLDGNLENGGFALVGLGGYSRMLNDAEDSPYTSIRGDADQWFTAIGIGYTF